MNEPAPTAPPPPPPSPGGCCGMGCATLFALIAFFVLAFIGGAFWTLRHYSREYTSSEPMEMPADITSETAAPVAPDTSAPGSLATTPVPARQLETQWKAFEKAADRNQKARMELSAGQINAILQNSKNARGKAYVRIENNVAHVRVSIPLKNVPLLKGRYLNGEATVESAPDGNPNNARISNLVLADKSVPEGVLDQRFFGASSMRGAVLDWVNKQNIQSFRIENDRVIVETRGD